MPPRKSKRTKAPEVDATYEEQAEALLLEITSSKPGLTREEKVEEIERHVGLEAVASATSIEPAAGPSTVDADRDGEQSEDLPVSPRGVAVDVGESSPGEKSTREDSPANEVEGEGEEKDEGEKDEGEEKDGGEEKDEGEERDEGEEKGEEDPLAWAHPFPRFPTPEDFFSPPPEGVEFEDPIPISERHIARKEEDEASELSGDDSNKSDFGGDDDGGENDEAKEDAKAEYRAKRKEERKREASLSPEEVMVRDEVWLRLPPVTCTLAYPPVRIAEPENDVDVDDRAEVLLRDGRAAAAETRRIVGLLEEKMELVRAEAVHARRRMENTQYRFQQTAGMYAELFGRDSVKSTLDEARRYAELDRSKKLPGVDDVEDGPDDEDGDGDSSDDQGDDHSGGAGGDMPSPRSKRGREDDDSEDSDDSSTSASDNKRRKATHLVRAPDLVTPIVSLSGFHLQQMFGKRGREEEDGEEDPNSESEVELSVRVTGGGYRSGSEASFSSISNSSDDEESRPKRRPVKRARGNSSSSDSDREGGNPPGKTSGRGVTSRTVNPGVPPPRSAPNQPETHSEANASREHSGKTVVGGTTLGGYESRRESREEPVASGSGTRSVEIPNDTPVASGSQATPAHTRDSWLWGPHPLPALRRLAEQSGNTQTNESQRSSSPESELESEGEEPTMATAPTTTIAPPPTATIALPPPPVAPPAPPAAPAQLLPRRPLQRTDERIRYTRNGIHYMEKTASFRSHGDSDSRRSDRR